ncbi:putative glycosyltransferase [Pseudogulbenkiania sp. NH8B]|uniref:PseG/SpsG family protein n=1 Tax=Pseudogulbenkiania sp. (strain NH8B) TaxID=748280 RepID=UPI000227A59E|nr:putative glycosyltransferase [Pseudogulbenkiania sp. NH8B]BAK78297.1 putative glycosyltransferase [Pseudogulbenkiania sp. NH8B]
MTDLHIYTEGDLQRGLGHLTRCSAYATIWAQQHGNVRWVVDGDHTARNMLHDGHIEWRTWQDKPVTERQDALAIVDSYSATLPVLHSIADNYRRVVYLDDTFRLPYPAGLVVHAAPGEPQPVAGEAEWLWGPAWQPLRPAFWNIPKRTHVAERVGRILILMGGTDLHNLTPRMVELARAVYPNAEIHAVIGPQPQQNIAGCITHRELNDRQIALLMCESDVAISAAGQATFELARCSLPTVLIAIADNQAQQYSEWSKTLAFRPAGWWSETYLDLKVQRQLEALREQGTREKAASIGALIVDGLGALRILNWMMGNEH